MAPLIWNTKKWSSFNSLNIYDFDPVQIESFYSGASLFSASCAVLFQDVFEREETRDFILGKRAFMSQSGNSFVFLEGKLNKPILDAFKKARAEINIFELPKEKL